MVKHAKFSYFPRFCSFLSIPCWDDRVFPAQNIYSGKLKLGYMMEDFLVKYPEKRSENGWPVGPKNALQYSMVRHVNVMHVKNFPSLNVGIFFIVSISSWPILLKADHGVGCE